MKGMESFVLEMPPVTKETAPETLLLDVNHLVMLREEFLSVTMGSAVFLRLSTIIPNGPLFATLAQWLTTIQISSGAADITAQLNDISYQYPFHSANMKAQAYSAIVQVCDPTDAFHRVVKDKLAMIWQRLSNARALEHNDTMIANVFKRRIEAAVTKFLTVCTLNRTVHEAVYNTLIREAIEAY